MKWLVPLALCFAAFPISSVFAEAVNPLYQKEIVFSDDASPEMKQSAEALAGWLEKITGQAFNVSQRPAQETVNEDVIQLLTAKGAGEAPALAAVLDQLDRSNVEAFVIDSNPGKPGLRIIGASALGTQHGVYRYLQELGFRWLFPGEHWQFVPKRESIRVDLNRAEAPVYKQRTFFGTGGFGGKLPLDPNMEVEKMWGAWRDANLFGQAFGLGGHYGEAFIRKNKEVLEVHPEYRAMVGGERVPMSSQFQLNYGNPELRELYIDDRLADLAKMVEKDSSRTYSVSVDPADGGGYCQSPESTALGSVSDQVFGLANDVAKRVQAEYPGNYVNLYAYADHCDVTTFPLEKNVIVSVIPYGFNYSKLLLGDDLLLAWAEKASLIGIYDYWGLPDWSKGQPGLPFTQEIPRRLKLWSSHNVRFFNAETTTGAGAAGIALYLSSKVLWNPQTDYHAELNAFYEQAFGPARAPMQRMLERWTSGFYLHENELAVTFRDLREAYDLAKSDPGIQARVEDFITYAHYLRLLREFEVAERSSEDRHQAADALQRFLWQTRKNAMVQPFRLSQLLNNRWAADDKALQEAWDFKNPEASGWATVPDYPTPEEIASLLESGAQAYSVLYEPVVYANDGNLTPLEPAEADSAETLETFTLFKGHELVFQADRDGELPLEVAYFNKSSTQDAIITVKEAGEEANTVLHTTHPLNGEWHTVRIPVEKGKNYRVSLNGRSSSFRLRFSASLPLVLTSGVLPIGWTSTKNWFYVPKGTERFAVYISGNPVADKTRVQPGDGVAVEPLLSKGGFTVYEVPIGEDGKAWSLQYFTSSHPIRLFNIPDNLAFSENTLLVPKEETARK